MPWQTWNLREAPGGPNRQAGHLGQSPHNLSRSPRHRLRGSRPDNPIHGRLRRTGQGPQTTHSRYR
jgi:hypothetical protein